MLTTVMTPQNTESANGILLKKGSSIFLEREGKYLNEVCIGLNWGVIMHTSFFGLIKKRESVDLDGSVTTFDKNKEVVETIYYHNLRSEDRAIVHSGDDRVGDWDGDDDLDNEIIKINLNNVSPRVDQIVFYLNSYNGQDFAKIPYSKIRIFEGNEEQVDAVFATYNLSFKFSFTGYVSMVMGKLKRDGDKWKFFTIGEPIKTTKIQDTIPLIQQKYL